MSGRNATASIIQELKGSFKTHPERKNKKEPKGKAVFDTAHPQRFDDLEIECWNEIINIVPDGVLTGSDKFQVEIVASLLAEFRSDSRGMLTAKLTRLCSEMGKLGLNPSARVGLQVEPESKNKFDD